MDYNEIKNEEIQRVLLKVEALQKEYEITLEQYQEAGKNYINAIQSSDNQLTSLKGRTWWGSKGVKEGSVDTIEDCENMCSSADNCSGATFNTVKHYCWARSGEGVITTGMDNDYAIITKQKAALNVMKGLNDKLINLTNQISSEIQKSNNQVESQDKEKDIKQMKLNNTYQKLLEHKLEMEKQIQEYYSLDEENTDQSLFVNQKNLSYRFWILLTILVLLLTINKIFKIPTSLSGILWLIIIYIFIIFTFTLTYPAGFAVWSIVLLWIIFMKLGYLPSP